MSDSTEKAVQSPDGDEDRVAGRQPEEQTAREPENQAPDLSAQLVETRLEAEENYNKYMVLAAELDNLRKRTVKEVEQARRYGAERLAEELLAAVDSLEMGIEVGTNATAEALLEGKRATLRQLLTALAHAGVDPIDPQGEPFDPNLHEAMTTQPSDTAEPGTILEVVQKGYRINGRLLRPARVIVASEPAA